MRYQLAFWLSDKAPLESRNRSEAIGMYESILALPPEVLAAVNEAVWDRHVRNGTAPADPKSWQIEPITSGAMHSLTVCYEYAGDLPKARAMAQRVLDLYPDTHSRSTMEAILQR